MKILVTGTTGFIGSHLLKKLVDKKYKIHAIVRPKSNLTNLNKYKIKYFTFNNNVKTLEKYIESNNFKGIIHLATYFLKFHQTSDINNLIQSNIYFPTILLDLACKYHISWFINTETQWQHYNNSNYSPVNLYAASKQAFKTISKYYLETSDIKMLNLVLCDTFGPNDTRNKILDLWYQIVKNNKSLNMSAGKQKIDIIYIDNVIDALLKSITYLDKTKLKQATYRITSNQVMTLKALASTFEKVTKLKLNINWGKIPYLKRQMMQPYSQIPILPNWQPKISIEEGIKKTFC